MKRVEPQAPAPAAGIRVRTSLEGKYLIATLFVILTSLLPLVIAFFLTIDTIKRESVDLFNREIEATVNVEKAVARGRELLATYRLLNQRLAAQSPDALELFERTEELEKEFAESVYDYETSFTAGGDVRVRDILRRRGRAELIENETSLLTTLRDEFDRHEQYDEALEDLIAARNYAAASAGLTENLLPGMENMVRAAESLSSLTATVVAFLGDAANQLTSQLVSSTFGITFVSVLLAVGISVLLVRHLTRPLKQIRSVAAAIAEGNYDVAVPELTHDEIGALGAAIDNMRGRIKRYVTVLNESHAREVKHLEEITELKDQFAFIAAHELKTPVAAIRWNVELMKEAPGWKKNSPEIKNALDSVQMSNLRLNTLVNDLLQISRLEKGTLRLTEQAVDPVKIVQDIVREVAYLAKDRGVSVQFTPPERPFRVRGDNLLLREILQNLISNAIKYNRTKGKATIRMGKENHSGWIEVEDQGMGFTPEDLKKIYTRFWRSDRVGDIEGTGLGLFIVKQFVDLMKGTIELKTKAGSGSTFRVTFPVAPMA